VQSRQTGALTCADAGVERLPPGAGAGPSRRQLNHQIALTWAGAECRCASIASLVRTNMGRAARFGRRAEVGDHGPGSDEVCSSKGSYSFVSPFCSHRDDWRICCANSSSCRHSVSRWARSVILGSSSRRSAAGGSLRPGSSDSCGLA